jgi:Mannosyltransferase (PIG-V)
MTRPTATARWTRSPLVPGAVIYVAVRLLTIAFIAIDNLSTHRGLVHHLSRWDGKWFLLAANHGWPSRLPMVDGHVAANPIAFFPIFPLMMRALSDVTGLSRAVSGLWLSGVTGLVAVIAVGALTRVYADDDAARRCAILFALSPGSFVFSMIYNEGLVITLTVVGLWALMRGRWWVAAVAGAVATATSPTALVFVVVAAWSAGRAILRRREWRALIAPVGSLVGFAAWMGYLWAHTGTLRAWQLTERGGWHSYPSLMYPVHVLLKFVTNPLSPTMTGQILVAGTVVSVAGLVIVFREHPPSELVVYATAAVVLYAASAPVGLRPRLVMLAFPITMAAATRWKGRTYRVLVAGSAVALALMTFETLCSWAVFP